jgi:peroxiredoxin
VEEAVIEGTKAPDFELPSTTGEPLGPGRFAGRKKVVLAFYPEDNTAG